jgi:hypothetical protein
VLSRSSSAAIAAFVLSVSRCAACNLAAAIAAFVLALR